MSRIAICAALSGVVMLLLVMPAFAASRRSVSRPMTAKPAPSAALDQPSTSAASPDSTAETAPFVPNTGRLRLFRSKRRAVAKAATVGDDQADRPAEKPLARGRAPRVMRYEEVARGVPLVPTTMLDAAPNVERGGAAPSAPAAPRAASPKPAPRVERLPPVDRQSPTRHQPRVILPQEPIVLYPETGK